MTLKTKSILKTVWEYMALTVGALSFAFAWESMMIPNGMSSGGLMGLCTILQFATGGLLDASVLYIVTNVALILLAVSVFGIGFGFKTVWCIGVSSLFMWILEKVQWLMFVPGQFFAVNEPFLIPILAGVFEAFGIGTMIRYGGSSGGSDLIALMVNKFYPVPMSKLFLVMDVIVITAVILLPDKSFADAVYGYEMAVTFSLVVDIVIVGSRSTVQVTVFSDRFAQIADYVTRSMERGVTVLHAQGWYTKSEKSVLLILMQRKQLQEVQKMVKSIDPSAFMSVAKVAGVYGEGFEEIKGGIQRPGKNGSKKNS